MSDVDDQVLLAFSLGEAIDQGLCPEDIYLDLDENAFPFLFVGPPTPPVLLGGDRPEQSARLAARSYEPGDAFPRERWLGNVQQLWREIPVPVEAPQLPSALEEWLCRTRRLQHVGQLALRREGLTALVCTWMIQQTDNDNGQGGRNNLTADEADSSNAANPGVAPAPRPAAPVTNERPDACPEEEVQLIENSLQPTVENKDQSQPNSVSAKPTGDATRPAAKAKVKGKHINERMLAMLQQNPDSVNWSSKRWSEALDCSKSTIAGTLTWKNIILAMRALEKAERQQRQDRNEGRLGAH